MISTPTTFDERGIEHAPSSQAWLRPMLGEIIWQIRQLLDVSGCAFLTIARDGGAVRPAASWFATEAVRQVSAPLLEQPFAQEDRGLVEAVDATGVGLLVHTWPVRTTAGRTLGGLMVCAGPPAAPLADDDLRAMAVFADLAALALERAELLDREERRAQVETLLNEAAHDITRSLEIETVYRAIVDQAARLTGASKVMLVRLEPATRDLRVVAAIGLSDRVAGARFRVGDGKIGKVAQTGEPYVSHTRDSGDWLGWVVETERISSFMHVPISIGPRLFGVVNVNHDEPDRFDESHLRLLVALARSSAAAIANALDFERERRIADALTRGFIAGPAPELRGVALGLVYQPAGQELGGGDVFGAWARAGGDVVVLVGDVAGKGLEVAGLSAMVRFFVEARAWDNDRPGDVLRQTHELLFPRLPGGTFVSAFLGLIAGGRLRYCNAGHAPALLVRGNGSIEPLAATGLPLGVIEESQYDEADVALGPDDLLFAATDGLVDARRSGAYFGDERLEKLLARHAPASDPQDLVEILARELEAWAPQVDDDVLILAARPTRVT